MAEDRKLNARLDRQISVWLLDQEKMLRSEHHIKQGRVLMECVAGAAKFIAKEML